MREAFDRQNATIEPRDCPASLDYQFKDALTNLAERGVAASSDGVFLFFAGDSYLWVSGFYAGLGSKGPRLITFQPSESVGTEEFPLSQRDYDAILEAAHRALLEPIPPQESSGRSHDACEYLAVRNQSSLRVRATIQAFGTDAAGLENEGGFRLLRESMESVLEPHKDHGT